MMKRLTVIALLLLLVAACSGQPEIWQGYGGDGSRSLSSRQRGPAKPRLAWVTDLEAENPGSPVVDGQGNIYVSHSGGSVTKVNSRGKIQWRFDSWVSGPGGMAPYLLVMPGDNILMSTLGSREQTFRLSSSGETVAGPEWLPWPSSVSPGATRQGYTVVCHHYVDAPGGVALKIFGILKGGQALWEVDFNEPGLSFIASNPVVLEDNRSYVFVETNFGDNTLLGLSPGGEVLWRMDFQPLESRGVGVAIAATQDGTVFFGTTRVEDIWQLHSPGWLYAVKDGDLLWRAAAGQRVVQVLTIPGMVVANVLRTKLLALDMAGKELWNYALAGWESNAVMDSRGRTYLAGINQETVWIKAVDSRGKRLWEYDTGQAAQSLTFLALANGVIYVVTDTGKLLALKD
jgi:hypothetical protein